MNDSADFVMYWWERAAEILTRKNSKLRRFGLVTTNSITQVFQRRTVARWLSAFNPNRAALSLVFAVADHPWTKATRDAAAVRIAMTVAQSGAHEGELATLRRAAKLDTDQPEIELMSTRGMINADLTVGVDVTRTNPLLANDGLCSPGMKLHGSGFIVSRSEAEMLGLGRDDRPGLERHIRPYRNGRDLNGRSRDKWVIDLYGLEELTVRRSYPEVHSYLAATVKKARERVVDKSPTSDALAYLERWWQFGKPRTELRPALTGLGRFIVTVETSKHRIFQFLNAAILPDNMLIVIGSCEAAHLALLSSELHKHWALATGGWLGVGNDARYSKSRCFDPFPFPQLTTELRAELAELGEGLDAHRKARLKGHPELTLTRLYNALEAVRARDLDSSYAFTAEQAADAERGAVRTLMAWHDDIDRATLAAYGWSDLRAADGALNVQGVLGRLVALNAERRLEEARGQVRWLRPEYQAPRSSSRPMGVDDRQADLEGLLASGDLLSWPREPRPQLLLIKGALAEADLPLSVDALVARFKGKKAVQEVPRLLATLERLGQVRAAGGRYTLLRAA